MITDEQLIEALRCSMQAVAADVHAPPDLWDGISPPRRRLKTPSVSGLIAACAAAVPLAVAGLAIVLLGRRAGPVAVPATRPPMRPDTVATLRSQLAILRRPQRRSDHIPAWGIAAEESRRCSNCLDVTKIKTGETRLLTTISQGDRPSQHRRERIYLVLGAVPNGLSGWHQHGRALKGVHLTLVGLTRRSSHAMGPTDQLLNGGDLPMPAAALSPRDVLITSAATVGVVADGVTRVKWELSNPGQTRAAIVYPTVQRNVAIAPWTPAPRSTSLI
ncbi:MAG: hypothetical protein M3065_18995, partial [Actinomycetota bacterium]|nr:hypothetical protein [Actinomycetota bacterium]